ncbi:MAG: DUF998 domain-containing protein [Acidimicrobiia bacterium]
MKQAAPASVSRWPFAPTNTGLFWPALAGIVGPPLFTVGFLAQEFFRRGEFNSIAEPVSALEAGPSGWIQQVNFVVFGVLIIAFALGLHRAVRPAKAGVAGPAILLWSGIGLILSAVFPLRDAPGGGWYDPTGLHTINGTIFFLSLGIGLIVISRRLARDPAWRGLSKYALWTGAGLLLMAVVFSVLVRPDGAPLHAMAGLVQRITIAGWFACIVTLGIRLRRIASSQASAPQS